MREYLPSATTRAQKGARVRRAASTWWKVNDEPCENDREAALLWPVAKLLQIQIMETLQANELKLHVSHCHHK